MGLERALDLLKSQKAHFNRGPSHVQIRTCSHDPGTTHCPGGTHWPRDNFVSVHGLTPVTVHMSFSLPRGNFERRVTRCMTPGNPPCRGNFSPCEQNAKVAPGKSSLAHAHY